MSEFSIAYSLRDSKTGYGDAGYDIGFKQVKGVLWRPLEDWKEILKTHQQLARNAALLPDFPEGIIWKQHFLDSLLQTMACAPRRRNHDLDLLITIMVMHYKLQFTLITA
jgi:hypothetical protein